MGHGLPCNSGCPESAVFCFRSYRVGQPEKLPVRNQHVKDFCPAMPSCNGTCFSCRSSHFISFCRPETPRKPSSQGGLQFGLAGQILKILHRPLVAGSRSKSVCFSSSTIIRSNSRNRFSRYWVDVFEKLPSHGSTGNSPGINCRPTEALSHKLIIPVCFQVNFDLFPQILIG